MSLRILSITLYNFESRKFSHFQIQWEQIKIISEQYVLRKKFSLEKCFLSKNFENTAEWIIIVKWFIPVTFYPVVGSLAQTLQKTVIFFFWRDGGTKTPWTLPSNLPPPRAVWQPKIYAERFCHLHLNVLSS